MGQSEFSFSGKFGSDALCMSAREQNQKKKRRPIDFNLLATSIVADATGANPTAEKNLMDRKKIPLLSKWDA